MRIFFYYFLFSCGCIFGQYKDSSLNIKAKSYNTIELTARSNQNIDSSLKLSKPKTPFFEGIITYKKRLLNPNPILISDEEFYQDTKNGGLSLVLVYIKGNKYKMETKEYVSIFDPIGYRVCIKDLIKARDTFYCLPVNLPEDNTQKIEASSQKDTILGKNCSSFLVKSPFSTKTIFYNSETLRTFTGFWSNHAKDDWGAIIKTAGTFPLKIITKSSFGNEEWEVTKIDVKALSTEDFEF
jgi:hypothetical protein